MKQHQARGRESIVVDIIETLSRAKGVDSRELHPPLFDAIDADALQRLIESSPGFRSLQFDYDGWTVVIDSDETVSVEPRTNGQ